MLIYRIPLDKSIIKPGSHCPNCNSPIPLYRNIPIISFILQWGKCHSCNSRISLQYPLVEFITAFLWVLGAIQLDFPEQVLFFWMSSILIAISVIDYYHKIIPIGLIFAGFIGLLFNSIYTGEFLIPGYGMLFGLAYLGGISFLTSLIFKKQTMGIGDLLLIAILGAWLGLVQVGLSIFFGSLIAVIGWIIISIKKGMDRSRPLPFAPFLSFSGILFALIKWNPFQYLFSH